MNNLNKNENKNKNKTRDNSDFHSPLDVKCSQSVLTKGQPLLGSSDAQLDETESQRKSSSSKETSAKSTLIRGSSLRLGRSFSTGFVNTATPIEQAPSSKTTPKWSDPQKNHKRLAKIIQNNDPLYRALVGKQGLVPKIRKVVPKNTQPFRIPRGVPAQYLKEWESRESKKARELAWSKVKRVDDRIFKIAIARSVQNRRQRRTAKYHAKSLAVLNIPHTKFTKELEIKYDVPRDQFFKQLDAVATDIKEQKKGFKFYIESTEGSKIRIVGYRLSGRKHLKIRKYTARNHRRPMKTSMERYYYPLHIRKYTALSVPGWRWLESQHKFSAQREKKIEKMLEKDKMDSSLSKWEFLLEAEKRKTSTDMGTTMNLFQETKNIEFTETQVAEATAELLVRKGELSHPDLDGPKLDLQKSRKSPKGRQDRVAELKRLGRDSGTLDSVQPISKKNNEPLMSLGSLTPAPGKSDFIKKPKIQILPKVENVSRPVGSPAEKLKPVADPGLWNPDALKRGIINKLKEILRR